MISAIRFESQTSKCLGLGFRHLTVSLLVFIIFGLALVGKHIVFRFIIEYTSLMDFAP
jgi:hypothetical protein